MDSLDLVPLIEQLNDNIDDLEDALIPFIKGALSDTASTLPLLDKAQLYVLITYAIESIIFSFLRLHGVNAKEHPVFRELTRVKQYFEKISHAELGSSKRETTLDKPAAGRFIKHALAGNDKFDIKRAQKQLDEKARAHIRFERLSNKRKRVLEETGSLDPNSQLVGAAKPESSNSLGGSGSAALLDDRPTMPGDSDLVEDVSEQEQHGLLPNEPSLEKELESGRKRRRREKGTLSRFNTGDPGPEEPIIPGKPSQTFTPDKQISRPVTSEASPGSESTALQQGRKRWKKEAKRAAKQAAKQSACP